MNPAYLLFDPAVKFLVATLACQLTAIGWCIALDWWESWD